MSEFILDKGGAVTESIRWSDLDSFTGAYVEALFWTNSGDSEHELTDKGFADLAMETLRLIMSDCERFQSSECADQILADCYMREGYGPENAGHDFWLTRCGHGTGFWDREQLESDGWGDVLTGIAEDEFGNVNAYLGDDGKVYLT